MKKLVALLVAVIVTLASVSTDVYASEDVSTDILTDAVMNGISNTKGVTLYVKHTLEVKNGGINTVDSGEFKINFKNSKITGETNSVLTNNNKTTESSMKYTFDMKKGKAKYRVISGKNKKLLKLRADKLYGNIVGFKYMRDKESLDSLFRVAGINEGTLEENGQLCYVTVNDTTTLGSSNIQLNVKIIYTFDTNTMKLVGLKTIIEDEREISTTELVDISY